jgi:hypothetical protein
MNDTMCRPSVVIYFMKERREQDIQDQSKDEHTVYTNSGLPEDKNHMFSVALLVLVDNERIAAIRNELACTDCQPTPSLGIGVTYL